MFENKEKAIGKSEHYDGETLKDVYGAAYRPEGNKARYIETRVYLQQVRDEKHREDLIKKRIQYRKEAGLDTAEAEQELAAVQDKLKRVTAEVAEEISKLYNVNLEMVMVKRYRSCHWSDGQCRYQVLPGRYFSAEDDDGTDRRN